MSADDPDDPDTVTELPPCSACRGTGRVISRLGGTDHEVECPWCDGGGRRLRDHDAQDRPHPDAGGAGSPGGDDDGDGGDDGPDLAA